MEPMHGGTSSSMKQQLQVGLLVAAFAVAMVPTTAWCRELCYNSSKVASASPPPGAPMATAVIVFGDSIVDPGNNNNLKTQIKANHAPYGMNFANGEPTGRYSNGLIPTDFIVQGLNVKQLLPPWLGVELSPEDLKTGVSFASGATGYDPLTPVIVSVITLDQQLEYFDDYRAKLVALVGEKETTRIIDGALFVVCAGTDDIANTYFTTPFRSVEYDIPSYVDLLVSGADQFLDKVAAKGARKIGFVGLPPVGCVPSQRTLGGGPHRRCEEKRNYAAKLFNSRMEEVIAGKKLDPATRMVYIDIYGILNDLVENGDKYGFNETARGCCGTGTIEVTGLCDTRYVDICDDVDQHVFFDSYHPTQRAYKIIVDNIFDNYLQFIVG
ncbi:GDSL esterase/lipase EXL3 [Oryza brachyantha]|uniref:GDSL esterase/lipase EXL3 n=1 Tax=Oryza brachyantha TaxID=4533 RepID=UPI001ADBAC22|nr:GDSL esterase/lipase EXL3 [Oryza brachyantha]